MSTLTFRSVLVGLALIVLSACGSNSSSSPGVGTLGCLASATVTAGNITSPNTTVTLSNLNIIIVNGGSNAFTVAVPGLSTFTMTNASYTYPGSFTTVTGTAGGIATPVTITNSNGGATASCSISAGGLNGGTGSIVVTASPSSTAAVGSTITLSATDSTLGSASSVFTFSQATAISGVTITPLSNSTASVTSSVATTVTITVTERNSTSSTVIATTTINLTFTGSGGTGGFSPIHVFVTPGLTVPVGTTINLSASTTDGTVNPSFTFVPPYYYQGLTVTQASSTAAYVTSSVRGTFVIYVNEYANGNQFVTNGQLSVSFY